MSSLIELRNIDMVFQRQGRVIGTKRKFHVLKNISLNIEEGEILALVGESGCGKTTLGKIITGLLRPTKGDLLYKGNSVYKIFNTNYQEFRKSVQFIQQDSYAALNPVRTVYQSIAAPIKAHNKELSKEQVFEKVEELLEIVGLIPAVQFIDKFPHQMSGGQRQRVLFARALTMKPRLIVADEPVSMIDVSLRLSILNLMAELNKKLNIAFVYITHDLATARYIANDGRIAVMYLGEIMELSSVSELLNNPKHPYTQALISAVPIPDPRLARQQKALPIKNMDFMSMENRIDGCPFFSRCIYGEGKCINRHIDYVNAEGSYVKCCNLEKVKRWEKQV